MPEPTPSESLHSRFGCPQCGSDSTQKLSAVYETGTSQINTQSTHGGFAMSGGNLVPIIGGSGTSGTQQSEAARKSAPPDKDYLPGCLGWLILIVGVPVGWFFAMAFCIVLVAITSDSDAVIYASPFIFWPGTVVWWGFVLVHGRKRFREVRRYNTDVWPGLMAEWERKWLCHRCGQEFVPVDS